MTRPVLRVMISAGEASGDRLGAGLAAALLQRDPSIDLVGMGGPQMRDAGVRLVQNSDDVSVVVISEVLARLPQIRRALQRLERAKAGEYYQLPAPGGDFDKFKASARGQRLGAGCVPGAWITIK